MCSHSISIMILIVLRTGNEADEFALAVQKARVCFTPITGSVGRMTSAAGWEDVSYFLPVNVFNPSLFILERKERTCRIRSTTRQQQWTFADPQFIRVFPQHDVKALGIAPDGRSAVIATYGTSRLAEICHNLCAKFPDHDPLRDQRQMHLWHYEYPGKLKAERVLTFTEHYDDDSIPTMGENRVHFTPDLRHFVYGDRGDQGH